MTARVGLGDLEQRRPPARCPKPLAPRTNHAYPVGAQDANWGRRWPQDVTVGALARGRIRLTPDANSATARILDLSRSPGGAS